jgi:predicted nucleic acid-binding protein
MPGHWEDLEDNMVLATAITARADVPVTGDRLLREIDRCEGVRILAFRDHKPESKGGRIPSIP